MRLVRDLFLAHRDQILGATVVPSEVVSVPEWGGDVLVSTCGDPRLATPGSADVLSGIIGAMVAQGACSLKMT